MENSHIVPIDYDPDIKIARLSDGSEVKVAYANTPSGAVEASDALETMRQVEIARIQSKRAKVNQKLITATVDVQPL